MENTITPKELDLPIKIIHSKNKIIDSSSDSSTHDGHDDDNIDWSNDLDTTISTLPDSNSHPCTSLKDLLINYIQTMPSLPWLPISISILSLAVTPDNSIPPHIILPKINPSDKYNNTKSKTNDTQSRTLTKMDFIRKRPRFKLNSINPIFSGFSSNTILKNNLPKLLVVLDMDETLMHMHTNPNIQYDYTINLVEHSTSNDPMFINCNIHPTMYISLRPGVHEFLKYLNTNNAYYEVALFTAGTKAYADAVMEGLDPNCTIIPIKNRYYRGSCELITIDPCILLDTSLLETKIDPNGQSISFLQKDLNKLNWPLTRTILLDNSLLSFYLYPENGIWIKSYHADKLPELNDNWDCLFKLSEATRLLEELKNVDDVRPHLSNQFKLSKIFCKSNADISGKNAKSNRKKSIKIKQNS